MLSRGSRCLGQEGSGNFDVDGLAGGFNINSELDLESAELIAAELDLTIQLRAAESLEESVISGLEEVEDDPDTLVSRPPIVILGPRRSR